MMTLDFTSCLHFIFKYFQALHAAGQDYTNKQVHALIKKVGSMFPMGEFQRSLCFGQSSLVIST